MAAASASPAAPMEIVAVAKDGVHMYSVSQASMELGRPRFTFPAVNTADGCEWSPDGNLLGLADTATGGVAVYCADKDYSQRCQVDPLIGGPIRNFYFSPLGSHLVTHERWVKDAGANVGVWDTKTGELKMSFVMKKLTDMTWPPLKWTGLETHCCRMVQDGVQILPGNLSKEEREHEQKINAPGIMAFELASRGQSGGGSAHVAICVAESKGAPAKCQIFRLDSPEKPTAMKVFYKAQSVSMKWNHLGTAVLCKTSQEVDDTGKSYYGGSYLYFIRADGEEVMTVCKPDDGALHDVQWSPTQDEFFLLSGDLPCKMTLHEGKKGTERVDFGQAHRNTIRWNNHGRFVVCGGYGQLLGDTDFLDRIGKRSMGRERLDTCVLSGWAPDGRHFMAATTAPRMRMDNKIVLYDYMGNMLTKVNFEELMFAAWRPQGRGLFQDRAPSPDRVKKPAAKAGAASGYPAEPKKQAYRPPGARGAGGSELSNMLKQTLGSTSAGPSTIQKVGLGRPVPGAGVPGMAPPPAADSGGNSRNARKKASKEKGKEDQSALLAAALKPQGVSLPPSVAAPAKEAPKAAEKAAAETAAAAPGAGAPAPTSTAAGSASQETFDNPEVEKKVRALRKKLREIAKLKDSDPAKLEPLQRNKVAGEGTLIAQIRELGYEP